MYAVLLSMAVFVAVILLFVALWVAVDLFASGGAYPRTWIVVVFKRLARLAVPDQSHHLDTVQLDLVRAGYNIGTGDMVFFATRALLAFGLPIPVFLLARPTTLMWFLTAAAVPATVGYILPRVWLDRKVQGRQRRLRSGIPNLLEMLAPALNSGMGIDGALRYVEKEMRMVYPELADSLYHSIGLVDAGIPRDRALQLWVEHTGVDELEPIAFLLGRAERSGVGVAEALQSHAEQFRENLLRTEEALMAKAGPMLTVLAIIFVLPLVGVVALGPTLLRLSEWFFGAGA